MPITIGSNISALQAQRRLNESSRGLQQTFDRLSSGLRITRASDDAAGLSISESLKTDSRVFHQGVRNFNDGLGVLAIADGALENLSTIVTRLKELATQSANGVYGSAQRAALDKEAQKLAEEYKRIIGSTEANGRKVFSGAFGSLSLQGGYGVNGGINSTLGGAVGTGAVGALNAYSTEAGASPASYANALGDLNGDGFLDIVSAGTVASGGVATVLLANGDGSFRASTSYATEDSLTTAVQLADLNRDGILDLVTAGESGVLGYVDIRFGNGNGTFGARLSYAMEIGGTEALVIEDLNSDGILDLISGGSDGIGAVSVRLGLGNGTFGSRTLNPTAGTTVRDFALGDLNNDGFLDLIAGHSNGGTGRLSISLGNGNGTFRAATSYASESADTKAVAVGDLNGDGNLDIVTAGYNPTGAVLVRLGSGTGAFSSPVAYSMESSGTRAVSLGDLNGDGNLDIVSAGLDASGGVATIRLGNGDGTFAARQSYTMGSSNEIDLELGDLNGDSVLDIVTASYSNGVSGVANVRLGLTQAGAGPLLSFSLKTRADALQALAPLDRKLSQIAAQRGAIGAFQSRVSTAISNLGSSVENFSEAASRITDADIAEEASQLVKRRILQQAGAAILGQANQQPALALRLLSPPDLT